MSLFRTSINQGVGEIKSRWNRLSTNKIVSLATYLAIIGALVGFISIVFSWKLLPPLIPLWYSKIWGSERLAATPWLFLLPTSTLIITTLNMYIASFLITEYLVFSQIMSLGSLVISMLSTITLLKIISLVV